MTQTIKRLYDSYDTALQAALGLKQAGFTDRRINAVGERSDTPYSEYATSATVEDAGTGAAFGGALGAAAGLMAGTGVLAIPGIAPIVAAGWLASTLAVGAAGAVAGGIVGALSGGADATDIQARGATSRRGDTEVTVRTPDDRALEATRILSSYPAVDPASEPDEYRSANRRPFDDSRPPPMLGRSEPILPAGLPPAPPN